MSARPRTSPLALLLAPGLAGCFTFKAEAGYVASPRAGSPPTALVTAHADVLASGHSHHDGGLRFDGDIGYQGVYGYGYAARFKVGPEIFQAAACVEGIVALNPEDNRHNDGGCVVCPYARGGVQVLQLGAVQRQLDVGVGSPYLQAGLAFCPNNDAIACVSLGGVAEYDVRFTAPNDAYFGATLGFGL